MIRIPKVAMAILVAILGIVIYINFSTVDAQSSTRLWAQMIRIGSTLATSCAIRAGTGTPEAVITGNVCDVYLRRDGTSGTVKYLKTTGTGNTGWEAQPTAASVMTFTNKTLDVEGTGNVLTIPFTEYWPAAVCDQGGVYMPLWSSNGGTEPSYGTCWAGTHNQGAGLNFADTGTGNIWQQFHLPSDWAGTIDAAWFWYSTATTGNVVWQLQTICVADGEVIDATWNTAQTVTDVTQGTASRFNTATLASVTTTGCAAGEMFFFRIVRDPTHASDTIAATATLVGFELKYRRAM